MSLNEQGALYNAAKAPYLQDVPVMATFDPDAMLWQEQALRTQVTLPSLTPTLPGQDTNTAPHGSRGSRYPTNVRSRFMSTATWA